MFIRGAAGVEYCRRGCCGSPCKLDCLNPRRGKPDKRIDMLRHLAVAACSSTLPPPLSTPERKPSPDVQLATATCSGGFTPTPVPGADSFLDPPEQPQRRITGDRETLTSMPMHSA